MLLFFFIYLFCYFQSVIIIIFLNEEDGTILNYFALIVSFIFVVIVG